MPRIQKSNIGRVTARGFVPRAADPSGLIRGVQQLGASIQKRQKEEDLSYLNGQSTMAFQNWSQHQEKLEKKFGSDSREVEAQLNDYINSYIHDVKNGAPSPEIGTRAAGNLESLHLSFLRDAVSARRQSFDNKNELIMDRELDLQLGRVKNNWGEAERIYKEGIGSINTALWMDEDKRLAKAIAFESKFNNQVISGWYESQPNKVNAIKRLGQGGTPVDSYYNRLGATEKEKLKKEMLGTYARQLEIDNNLRTAADRADKQYVEGQLRRFFDFDTTTDAERRQIFDQLKVRRNLDPGQMVALQKVMAGGDTIDDQGRLFKIKNLIRNQSIRTVDELLLEVGDSVSFNTMSNELVPMIQSYQDRNFQSAMNILKSEVGIPTGLDLFPERRTAEQKAAVRELEMFKVQNPDGDFVAEAVRIGQASEEKKAATAASQNAQREARLVELKNQYQQNPSNSLRQQIIQLKAVIEANK